MKLSKLIAELNRVQEAYGDIEAQLQNSPKGNDPIVGFESFFVVPEEYELIEDSGGKEWVCNIRSWPY